MVLKADTDCAFTLLVVDEGQVLASFVVPFNILNVVNNLISFFLKLLWCERLTSSFDLYSGVPALNDHVFLAFRLLILLKRVACTIEKIVVLPQLEI